MLFREVSVSTHFPMIMIALPSSWFGQSRCCQHAVMRWRGRLRSTFRKGLPQRARLPRGRVDEPRRKRKAEGEEVLLAVFLHPSSFRLHPFGGTGSTPAGCQGPQRSKRRTASHGPLERSVHFYRFPRVARAGPGRNRTAVRRTAKAIGGSRQSTPAISISPAIRNIGPTGRAPCRVVQSAVTLPAVRFKLGGGRQTYRFIVV